MNWFKKISWAKIVPPDKAVPEEDLTNGLWYYALRLRDGTLIYDSVSHQIMVMQNQHLFANGGGLESIGFINQDGSYEVKMSGSELDEYLHPSKYKKAQTVSTLGSIMNKWQQRGVTLYLYEKGNVVVLDSIIVPKDIRRQGIGSQIMKEITDYADQMGKRIELSPAQKDDYHETTSRKRLIDFYKRFGLIQNKGRNKDFTTTRSMYREPKHELV